MTRIVGRKDGLAPLAQLLHGHNRQLDALSQRKTQYFLDDGGSALAMLGDLALAPVHSFVSTLSTLEPTGLTGVGFAVYVGPDEIPENVYISGGHWVQLSVGVDSVSGGYADVSATAPPALSPTFSPPEGLLWVDTSEEGGDAFFNIWTGSTTTGLTYTVGNVAHSNFYDATLTGDWSSGSVYHSAFIGTGFIINISGTVIGTWVNSTVGQSGGCAGWTGSITGYVRGLVIDDTGLSGLSIAGYVEDLVIINCGANFDLIVWDSGYAANVFVQGGSGGTLAVEGTLADCFFGNLAGAVNLIVRPGSEVRGCGFGGSVMYNPAMTVNGRVTGCDFTSATIAATANVLINGVIDDCLFYDATLTAITVDAGSTIKGSDLSGANLTGTIFSDTLIYNSNLNGTDLSGVNLTNCRILNHDLHGQDLSGANYSGMTLGAWN
jgi:Pentapeptide repeats (8 copies)